MGSNWGDPPPLRGWEIALILTLTVVAAVYLSVKGHL